MERRFSPPVRGIIAGFVGAALLALWFFVVDIVRGDPLGSVTFLSSILMGREILEPAAGPIALYTLFHFTAFILLGIALDYFFEGSPIVPNILMGVAVGLLLFAGLFYAGVVVLGVEILEALGWPQILVGNVLAGVGLMETLRQLGPHRAKPWREALGESKVLTDGVIAGALGAVTVALWFFIPDLIYREAFFTPAAMGSALFFGVTEQAAIQITVWTVFFYTVIHFGVFILIALLASAILNKAEEYPRALFFGMLFFVTYAAFFFGLIAIFGEWILGALAWYNIALGSLFGVAVMAYYLVRAHPRLRKMFQAQESATAPPPLRDRSRERPQGG